MFKQLFDLCACACHQHTRERRCKLPVHGRDGNLQVHNFWAKTCCFANKLLCEKTCKRAGLVLKTWRIFLTYHSSCHRDFDVTLNWRQTDCTGSRLVPVSPEIKIKISRKKYFPSSRIRTSDLRITANHLQSSALPTELSRVMETCMFIYVYVDRPVLTKTIRALVEYYRNLAFQLKIRGPIDILFSIQASEYELEKKMIVPGWARTTNLSVNSRTR